MFPFFSADWDPPKKTIFFLSFFLSAHTHLSWPKKGEQHPQEQSKRQLQTLAQPQAHMEPNHVQDPQPWRRHCPNSPHSPAQWHQPSSSLWDKTSLNFPDIENSSKLDFNSLFYFPLLLSLQPNLPSAWHTYKQTCVQTDRLTDTLSTWKFRRAGWVSFLSLSFFLSFLPFYSYAVFGLACMSCCSRFVQLFITERREGGRQLDLLVP